MSESKSRISKNPRARKGGARRRAGFAIAPILYLLGLIGVGAAILFSGYSQILRSSQQVTNAMTAKADLQQIATTLAATSVLGYVDNTVLCPPTAGYDASSNCTSSPINPATQKATAIAGQAQLPANNNASVETDTAYLTAGGSPVEVGVFMTGSGVRQLDPWGHYYMYCRWENHLGTPSDPAILVISAGPDGTLDTNCSSTGTATGDDLEVFLSVADVMQRANVWETTTVAVGSQIVAATQFGIGTATLNVDAFGDLTVPGWLNVDGAATFNGGITGTTGNYAGQLKALSLAVGSAQQMTVDSSGNIATSGVLSIASGDMTVSSGGNITTVGSFTAGSTGQMTVGDTGNIATSGTLAIGSSALTVDTGGNLVTAGGETISGALTQGSSGQFTADAAGDLSTSGTLGIGGVATFGSPLTIGSAVPIGTTMLLKVGKITGSTPLMYVDASGNVTASSFNGTLNGSVNGGTVTASQLTVNGTSALNGDVTGSGNATFASGTVTAAHFVGGINVGGGSGGSDTITGTLPLANGGTGYAAASYSNLFDYILTNDSSPTSTIPSGRYGSNSIPGGAIETGTVTTTQMNNPGSASPDVLYNSFEIDASGRIISAGYVPVATSSISDTSGDAVALSTSAGGVINFVIGGDVMDVINSQGYLGLGTTTPTQMLTLNGGNILIQGPVATNRQVEYATVVSGAPSERWTVETNSTAEGGLNAGSDFVIQNYSDTGTVISTPPPLTITRSTGASTFGGAVTAPSFIATGGGFSGNGSGITNIQSSNIVGNINLGTSAADTNPQRVSDQTTGLFSSATGAVSVASQGSEIMRVNGTGLGVGTNAPGGKLAVNGGAAIGSYGGSGTAPPTNGLIVSGNVGVATTAPLVSMDLSQNTDALAVPVGTTGQRPTGGNVLGGMIRYNTDYPTLEAYIGNQWVTVPGGVGGIISVINGGTGNSTLTQGALLVGNGTSAIGTVSDVAGGAILTSQGAGYPPAWSTVPYIGTSLGIGTAAPSSGLLVSGNVGIGTSIVNSAAGLQIFSTTQGVLLPQVTASQELAIGTNANSGGLVVYNTTDNELDVYDSSTNSWEAVGANANDAAGSTGQVQFNTNGELNASPNFYWNNATIGQLGIDTATVGSNAVLAVNGGLTVGSYAATGAAPPVNGLLVSGNVGIGTNAPTEPLQVNGSNQSIIRANATSGYGAFELQALGTTKAELGYVSVAGNYGAQTSPGDVSLFVYGNMHFVTGTSGIPNTAMYISSGGNVGIGTTSPNYPLQVQGQGQFNGTYSISINPGTSQITGTAGSGVTFGADGHMDVFSHGATPLYLYANGDGSSNVMVLNSSGDVGIGTTNPAGLLSVGATNQFSVNSSGDVTAGVWQGTPVALLYGGTGQTTAQAARGSTSLATVQGLNIDEMTVPSAGNGLGDTNYTILTTDRIVAVGTSALTAARTWTLPLGSSLNAGQTICVVDKGGGVNIANALTIAAHAGGDTINGAASMALTLPYTSTCVASDSGTPTAWSTVGGGGTAVGTSQVSGVLSVPQGGTGVTTETLNVIYKGNGISPIQPSSLTDNGTAVYTAENVGIGTTAPLGILDVEGGTAAASTNGVGVNLIAQTGGSLGNGGTMNVTAGSAGTGAVNGGNVNITSGGFANSSGSSGSITMSTSGGSGNGNTGGITIAVGSSAASRTIGAININGGSLTGVGAGANTPGGINLTAGYGQGENSGTSGTSSTGGAVTLTAGAGGMTQSTTGTGGTGGAVALVGATGGAATATGGTQTGGAGGPVTLTAGTGGAASNSGGTGGNGGKITLQGGVPGSGASANGSYGNIVMQASGGNVGIGTTTPTQPLAVYGPSYLQAMFQSIGTASGGLALVGGHQFELQSTPAAAGSPVNSFIVYDRTAGAYRMTILGTGNVGLGLISPQNLLDVNGAVAIGTQYAGTYTAPTGGLLVQGNVGIGTTAPTSLLDVEGTATTGNGGAYTSAGLTANTLTSGSTAIRLRSSAATRYRSDLNITSTGLTINAYDDTGGVYLPFVLNGSQVTVSPVGTNGTGSFTFAAPNSNGDSYATLDGLRISGSDKANSIYQSTGNLGITTGGGTINLSGGAVGIGTATPNSAAALQVFSTTQGLLLPQVTGTQEAAIGTNSTAGGLVVYNTTANEVDVYDNSTNAWEAVGANAIDAAGSTGWVQFNNGGEMDASANFFWNNTATGQLGIDTATIGTNVSLAVNGGMTVGSYAATDVTAPSNGMIVSGNVGIGTATLPGSYGQLTVGTPNTQLGISLVPSVNYGAGIYFDTGGSFTSYGAIVSPGNSTELHFYTGSTPAQRMYLSFSGTLGIGTTLVSASNLLEVNGAASIGYPDTYGGSANGLIVAGNVGIGTTAPTSLLSVGATNGLTVDGSGDVALTTPTAATSGSTQIVSPNFSLNSNYWTGSASAADKMTMTWTSGTSSQAGLLLFSPSVSTNYTNEVRYAFQNTFLDVENVNDVLGAAYGETYGTAYFGLDNLNGSASGIIPAHSNYSFLALENTGAVGTVQQAFSGAPSFRNLLDDGSSSARMGIGTATPNTAAALQVFSTTKGLLLPQVSATQEAAIGTNSTAGGLIVYNTTENEVDVYDNTTNAWEAVGANAVDAAGSTGWVQFNNGGEMDASANFFWNNSTNQLGIGTTVPYATLDVRGQGEFGETASNGYATPLATSAIEANLTANSLITVGESSAGSGNPAITMYRTNAGARLGTGVRLYEPNNQDNLYFQFGTIGTSYGSESYSTVMAVSGGGGLGGGVGIGTTTMSSSNKLEVNGAASIGYPYTYGGSAGGLIVSGNVGIGTATPNANLEVVASGGVSATIQAGGNGSSSGNAVLNLVGSNAGTLSTATIQSNYLGGIVVQPGGDPTVTIGASSPVNGNTLSVSGKAAIGASFIATAAPTNGLIVQSNVGIGTALPVAALDTRGTGLFEEGGSASVAPQSRNAAELRLSSNSLITVGEDTSGNANPAITLYRTSAGNNVGTGARMYEPNSAGNMYFQFGTIGTSYGSESYSTIMAMNYNGPVGIGTTTMSNSNKLEVNGAASIGYPDTYGNSANGLIVAGNVGVGSSSPSTTLDVNGSGRFATSIGVGVAPSGVVGRIDATVMRDNNNQWIDMTSNNSIRFYSAANVRMTIANTGVVTIGDNVNNVILQATGGSVGIGTTAIQSDAALQVFSTTQGLLLPQVTATQEAAIGTNSSSGGLIVYNTTENEVDVYDNSTNSWEAVGANAVDAAGSTGWVQFNNGGEMDASQNFFWDNTNGRLGIGTSAPISTLQVGSGQITVPNGSATAPSYTFSSSTNDGIYLAAAGQLAFTTAGLERMQLNGGGLLYSQSGNGFEIQFGGASGTFAPFAPNRSDLNAGIGANAAGNVSIIADNGGTATEMLRITGTVSDFINGNVGIGTTSPAAKLDVYGGIDIEEMNGLSFPGDAVTGYSIAIGSGALGSQVSAGTSTIIGNTAVGYQAIGSTGLTTAAVKNTGVGYQSLSALTSGYNNTAVGYATNSVTTGYNNTAIGYNAQAGGSGHDNIGIGYTAGNGSTGNNGNGIWIGNNSHPANGSGTSSNLVIVGNAAAANGDSVSVGYQAGYGISAGTSYNTFLGYQAGYDNSSGAGNIMIGAFPATGVGVTTGSNNIMLGYDVRPPSQTASGQLNIGNLIYATGLGTGSIASTGNVGIGTTNPGTLLTAVTTGDTWAASFQGNGIPGTRVMIGNYYGNADIEGVNSAGTGGALLAINSAQGITAINPNGGNVGIGSTAPVQALDVNGMIAADGSSSITGAPPAVGTNVGWKLGLYGTTYALGIANATMAAKVGGTAWFSIFANSPANTGNSTTPDTNAVISLGGNGEGLFNGPLAVGTTTPNSAAALQVFSTTQGLLLPQVSATQELAIGTNSHAGGLVVYNTTANEVDVYDNSTNAWEAVGANAADAAGSTGQVQFNNNGDLDASANFFWDNTNGRLGIGTSVPVGLLQLTKSASNAVGPVVILDNPANTAGDSTALIDYDSASASPYRGALEWSIVSGGTPSLSIMSGTGSSLSGLTTRLFIDQNGNVGIGTTLPTSPLTLVGLNQDIFVNSTTGAQATLSFQHNSGSTYKAQVGTYTQGSNNVGLAFSVDNNGIGNPAMYIQQTGNVGIGTTAIQSAAALQVFSTTKGLLLPQVSATQEAAIGTNSSSGGLVVYNTTANEVDVYDSSTNAWEAVGANAADAAGSTGQVQFNNGGELDASANFFWDNPNGRLGIGTGAPVNVFEVRTGANQDFLIQSGANWSIPGNGIAVQSLNDAASVSEPLSLQGSVLNLQPLGGNVGIGTTAPTQLLEVGNGNMASADWIKVDSTGNSGATAGIEFYQPTYGTSYIKQDSYGSYAGGTGALGHGLNFASGRSSFTNFFFRDNNDNVGVAITDNLTEVTSLPYAANLLVGGSVGIGTVNPAGSFSIGTTNQFSVNSSGTVTAGIWQGNAVGIGYGGTNAVTATGAVSNLLANPSAGNYAVDCTSGTSCTTVAMTSAAVTSFSAGTTGLTPSSATTGAITLAGTLAIANGGTSNTTAQAARSSTGLDIDEMTIPTSSGNVNYQILTTDRTVAVGTTALTAARTWTLPLGSQVNAGQTVCIVDKGGGVNSTDTLTINTLGSDTVLPSTSTTLKTQYGSGCFASDGATPAKWTSVGGGGAATPGGVTTDVQYNSGGLLAGDSSFTYAGSGGAVTMNGSAATQLSVTTSGGTAAISGTASSGLYGVYGSSGTYGVYGTSSGYGVYGVSSSYGVGGTSTGGTAVYGNTSTGYGISGNATSNGIAGYFTSTSGYALITGTGNVGFGTGSPDQALSFGSASTIDIVRAASGIGNNLTLKAGGGASSATNANGGNLILSGGISTGTGSSGINFQTYNAASASGTSDNAATTAMTLTSIGTAGSGTYATTLAGISAAGLGTNINGGTLTIAAGVPTGNGTSNINFNVYTAGTSGNSTNTNVSTAVSVLGANGGNGTLHFVGASGSAGSSAQGSAGGSSGQVQYNSNGAFAGAGNLVYNSTTGAVGVGTTLPITTLEVRSASNQNLYVQGAVSASNGATIRALSDSAASYETLELDGGPLILNTNSLGSVGIGTTAPSYPLDIWEGASFPVRMRSTSYSSGWVIGPNSANNDFYVINESNVGVYVVNGGTSWTANSDIRLKTNVQPYNVLDKLGDYRAVSFDWKSSGRHEVGVIAQELYRAFPEIVIKGDDDLTKPVSMGGKGAWGVSYDRLGALAMEGVKELNAKLDALEANVTATVIAGLKDFGILIEKGVTRIAELAADHLTVGSHEHPTGITLYDDTDGSPYCVKIHAGALINAKGACKD